MQEMVVGALARTDLESYLLKRADFCINKNTGTPVKCRVLWEDVLDEYLDVGEQDDN